MSLDSKLHQSEKNINLEDEDVEITFISKHPEDEEGNFEFLCCAVGAGGGGPGVGGHF
ncbi:MULTISPECIES: hypothetical protein [Pantoea]|jgi:hypothetical protein|uniref:hypothetical protein n=1 Tax=Pantoea TaxID=53335 RepID=UPI000AF8A252|nr:MULTISPECIES: hypothetical protein [Pantoea]MDF7785842.1 hypothetical protein [Pantoea stewartii]USL59553.1 hypothetical protein IAQ00_07290 [Pantoea ananatis]WHU85313.1 hypothetical protein A7P61_10170 [Pantoea agglomerans pv. betae]